MRLLLIMLFVVSCGRGDKGRTGNSGRNGVDGKDGSSCHVESLENGARLYCDDGSQSVVYNGEDGSQGEQGVQGETGVDGVDGQNGISPVLAIIDPCGDKPGKYDEVLLKTDSGLISYFESNGKKFLARLSPGTYVTTDDQACNFRVNVDNTITEL
jgi:hypothetical protein